MTAVDLVRQFEGCKLTAYRDMGGILTIGYGHTGKDVFPGLIWTQDQADEHLVNDVTDAAVLLTSYSPGPFCDGAKDALTDFVFNLGIGNYRTSTLRKLVDAQAWDSVKTALLDWDHANGLVVPGLLARRQAEADLINSVGAP